MRPAGQINGHHLRPLDIIGAVQKLLDQLRPALADGHCTERAITRVAVRAEDHLSAAAHHFAHILMDDRLMRGHINASVFFRGGQPEHVVVLIDCAANGAQAVVAVGQHIRQREPLKPRRARRLDDADIRDVVRRHRVKFDLQLVHVPAGIVRLEN